MFAFQEEICSMELMLCCDSTECFEKLRYGMSTEYLETRGNCLGIQNSFVGIMISCELETENYWFDSQQGQQNLSSPNHPPRLWDPLNFPLNRYGFEDVPMIKAVGAWLKHSPHSNAEVKNKWIHNSTPPHLPSRCIRK
jgi:hypothetical protein